MSDAELPAGWAQAALGDLVEVLDSRRVPVSAAERANRQGKVPYYGAAGQVGWIDDFLFDEELLLLGEDGIQFFDPRKPKAYLIRGKSWVNNHAHVLRPRPECVDIRFLCHFLNRVNYTGYANGSTRLKLTKSAMQSITVIVPPIAEQRRIVAVLEDHLSRLGAAESQCDKVLHRLRGLRESVVRASLEGATCHPRTRETTLKEAARQIKNGISVSRPGQDPDGVAILRIGAVRPLALDLSDLRYSGLSPQLLEESGSLLENGDLLFVRYNGNPDYVGACAVVEGAKELLTYPDKLIRVRIDTSQALPEYIAAACTVGKTRMSIRGRVKTTAGQAGISGRDLGALRLQLPPLENQRRAVSQIQSQLAGIVALEKCAKDALRRAQNLRRSLLSDAFAGRLVPQDPAEETASLAMALIRAERESRATERKSSRVYPKGSLAKTVAIPRHDAIPVMSEEPMPSGIQEGLF